MPLRRVPPARVRTTPARQRVCLCVGTILALAATPSAAQAPTPDTHPGYVLAQAIAARGCVLHQDDVGAVMGALGLGDAAFPQMAVPLMQSGFLRPSGEGTLTLVNWGLCIGGAGAPLPAQ